jgi:lipopolysaccharide/colanic/teichoic acid biosynthesis glycosyltransferase
MNNVRAKTNEGLYAVPETHENALSWPAGWSTEVVKAVFDRLFAFGAIIFFSPLMLLIAAGIYITDGGPIVYQHKRIGRNGQHFRCLKFRTMVKNADHKLAELLRRDPEARREWNETMKLRNDPRVHRLGAFLRKTSLDELPQFFNVLRGEMSVVGPRPIVDAEIPRYGDAFSLYAKVKPGITGIWQVSGRNDVSYVHRVAMDADYVRNRSFLRDLGIIAATVGIMIRRRGAY